ncbi:SAM-dependent methyltransferase [Coxiella endosymbiont of Amblyomma sculptum]|uniref:class I SAM-dependent methyltransferase n=1 Tax=Coxiella endosymbiont of Amblyomma sculptum TaxID=2487929 RepID=UPI00132F3C4E|nr:SAM-dependent methyltransferase [Coxiella endosymbiont of Amblyomma sculptum]QHG92239.1 SAM-dependent methyltransferase [Coxiella endosymbiont of Amblyomma sculptum]
MLIKNLPVPSPFAQFRSDRLKSKIIKKIIRQGPLTFAHYMRLALYSRNLGYYSANTQKFGKNGDFVTAPEISSIFSRCLARQCHQVLRNLKGGDILELGAGSGIMAIHILKELQSSQCPPIRYFILEISENLRKFQRKRFREEIPELFSCIVWVNKLPTDFIGIIVGNEVIDSLPVHKFKIQNNSVKEMYVDCIDFEEKILSWKIDDPSSSNLIQQIEHLEINFPNDYESEVNLLLESWIISLANVLKKGIILLIDYGFPQHEYYHPNRSQGTVTCHYQHYSHFNPLILPGIQDITAHVDFTAVAEIAACNQLTVAGFVHQADFLLNCNIVSFISSENSMERYQNTQQLKKLVFPSEMGEFFKAIALTRNYSSTLLGFTRRNQTARLSLKIN